MFFKKKVLTSFAAILLAVSVFVLTAGIEWLLLRKPQEKAGLDELYSLSVEDAVFAEEDEIIPLVEIDKESSMVSWNEEGDSVLMMTLHKYPDSYPDGSEVSLKWGEVWTVTEKEFIAWYKENGDNVTDWSLRLNQLLGMPADNGATHITAMWVKPDALLRPAYETDITKQVTNGFDENNPESDKYIQWFNNNIIHSYFDSAYPWTRLGYTYDWADNGKEYGLSEFLIQKDAEVKVEFTKTISEFIAWTEKQ